MKTTHKRYVLPSHAHSLKKLGYNEGCTMAYDNCDMLYRGEYNGNLFSIFNSNLSTQAAAPLWCDAFDWFCNEYHLDVNFKMVADRLYVATVETLKTEDALYYFLIPLPIYELRKNVMDYLIQTIQKRK